MLISKRLRLQVFFAAILALLLLLSTGGHFAQAEVGDASLYSLLPADCTMFISADSAWAWKTVNDLPGGGEMLQSLEKQVGFSLEKNLLPWAGQVAFASTVNEGNSADGVLYVQIRDGAELSWAMITLRTAITKKFAAQWKADTYRGVEIQRSAQDDLPFGEVAIARYDGWLVIGLGEGNIEKAIDTRAGITSALEKNPAWAKALAQLAGNPTATFGANEKWLVDYAVGRHRGAFLRDPQEYDGKDGVIALSLTENEDGSQVDVAYSSSADSTRKYLRDLRKYTGTVNGELLGQMPKSTIAALLLNKPEEWADAITNNVFARQSILMEVSEGAFVIPMFQSSMRRCTGEYAVGITHDADRRFDYTFTAKADSNDNAEFTAEKIKSLFDNFGTKVIRDGSLYKIAEEDDGFSPFSMPCWEFKDCWVRLAGKENTLAEKTGDLKLPAEAEGAGLAALGNLSFVPSMLQVDDDDSFEGFLAHIFKGVNWANAKWLAYLQIDPEGDFVHARAKIEKVKLSALASFIVAPRVMNASRKAREASLVANLHMLRNAVEAFHTDTGYLPVSLKALTRSTAAPTDFIRAGGGNPKTVPTSWHGPYLFVQGGVDELPTNPFANEKAVTADKQWKYDKKTGSVTCPPDNEFIDYPGRTTLGGKAWTQL